MIFTPQKKKKYSLKSDIHIFKKYKNLISFFSFFILYHLKEFDNYLK